MSFTLLFIWLFSDKWSFDLNISLLSFLQYIFLILKYKLVLETGFLCATLVVLELPLQIRLAPNSKRFAYLCLPTAGTKGNVPPLPGSV